MKFRLSPFVGRGQLPGDEVAFERVARAFTAASKPLPAKQPVASVSKPRRAVTPQQRRNTKGE